jgi:hypothetical protein
MQISKLAIGTAQFGLNYGINKAAPVNLKEIRRILNFAKKNKINTLDTAYVYKNAETKLGIIGVNDWNIISKIPPMPKTIVDEKKWIYSKFLTSLKNLRVSNINTVLIHDSNTILNRINGDRIYKTLDELKKNKLVKNIGCSIYSPSELNKLIKRYNFDVVQAPFNIFDRRILTSGLSKIIERKKIKLHLRSIFLQGLLLVEQNNLNKKFSKYKKKLSIFHKWAKENKITYLRACISMVSQIKFQKLIVGVFNHLQLEDIVYSCSQSTKSVPDFYIKSDDSLINPSRWEL